MPRTLPLLVGLLALLATLLLQSGLTMAQSQNMFNPRDDDYRLLGLIRAKAEYEQAIRDWERSRKLADDSLIPASELDRIKTRMENARVDYLQASLAVIFEQPHVLIEKAVKYQDEQGNKLVSLTLRNTTGSAYQSETLAELIDEDILGQLEPEKVRSVFVSLKTEAGSGGAIISSPYEQRIDELDFGVPVELVFRLLQDRDEVTVSITYAGQLDEKVVYLEKDSTANIVTIQSTQFSQEADLGTQAEYDLALEQFTSEANTFRLEAVGLPRDVRYEFRDPASGARLTQVRFPVGVSQRNLTLTLYLPQRAGGSLPQESLDRPLPFYALVMDEGMSQRYNEILPAPQRSNTDAATVAAAVQQLDTGQVELELIPRGVGRIDLQAPNLYHEITPGEVVVMAITLRNDGSRQLDSLRLLADSQIGWRGRVEPDLIPALAVDDEAVVRLTLEPPEDVAVGDYQVRVRAESAAADRRVESQETTVRVHVTPAPNHWLTVSLGGLLLGLVSGIVVFGVRLTRS